MSSNSVFPKRFVHNAPWTTDWLPKAPPTLTKNVLFIAHTNYVGTYGFIKLIQFIGNTMHMMSLSKFVVQTYKSRGRLTSEPIFVLSSIFEPIYPLFGSSLSYYLQIQKNRTTTTVHFQCCSSVFQANFYGLVLFSPFYSLFYFFCRLAFVLNTLAVKRLLKICKRMKRLEVLVHLSTGRNCNIVKL